MPGLKECNTIVVQQALPQIQSWSPSFVTESLFASSFSESKHKIVGLFGAEGFLTLVYHPKRTGPMCNRFIVQILEITLNQVFPLRMLLKDIYHRKYMTYAIPLNYILHFMPMLKTGSAGEGY